jgi:hypothetical protein
MHQTTDQHPHAISGHNKSAKLFSLRTHTRLLWCHAKRDGCFTQRLTTYIKSEECPFNLVRSPRRSGFNGVWESRNKMAEVPPITRHPSIRQHLRKLFERMDRRKYMHTYTHIYMRHARGHDGTKPIIPNK